MRGYQAIADQLSLLASIARQEVLQISRRDSCIATSKVVCDAVCVLGLGQAEMVSARATVYNPFVHDQFFALPPHKQAWGALNALSQHRRGWNVAIGYPQPGWCGHVVVAVDRRYIVDASLDQGDRQAHGIRLDALVMDFQQSFFHVMNGCLLHYVLLPDDRGWAASPDLHSADLPPLLARVVERFYTAN